MTNTINDLRIHSSAYQKGFKDGYEQRKKDTIQEQQKEVLRLCKLAREQGRKDRDKEWITNIKKSLNDNIRPDIWTRDIIIKKVLKELIKNE